MTVLVLARDFDTTADSVVTALSERGVPVFRTDLSAFPQRLWLDARLRSGRWTGRLFTEHRSVRLEDIRSIWNRNPSTYTFPAGMSEEHRDVAFRESKLGLGGVLAALDVVWVSHPNRTADAIFKPYQWVIAAECGLLVADTAITNDPASAERFLAGRREPGEVITKALGPAGVQDNGQVMVAYTRRLDAADVASLETVSLMPATLQEFVPKSFEVRLTVIGSRWFPIALHATTTRAYDDWRSDPAGLSYEPVTVPDAVQSSVDAYLQRTGLVYAGLDFVVTPSGAWVLLEVNTGPEWAWLEEATGAAMTEAMVDLLAAGPRR